MDAILRRDTERSRALQSQPVYVDEETVMSLLPLYNLLRTVFKKPDRVHPPVRLSIGEYAPYYSQKLPKCGKIPEIISTILAAHNIKVQYNWAPWASAYEAVQKKQCHGSFIECSSPQETDDFYYSEPILFNELVFFHRKRVAIQWRDLRDLRGLRSGGTLRSIYLRRFHKAVEMGQISIDWCSDDILNLSNLLNGKIDIFPLSKEVGLYKLQYYCSPQERAQITFSATPLNSTPDRLMLSKARQDSKQIVEHINCGLRRIAQTSPSHFKS